jgi:hypothetical protein
MEEARRHWYKILEEQFDDSSWIDLFEVKQSEKCKMYWYSFMDCVTFHLLSVFRSDTAETQRFYAICTKDPATQWLLGPIALPFLL